jgi:hypothetical protein
MTITLLQMVLISIITGIIAQDLVERVHFRLNSSKPGPIANSTSCKSPPSPMARAQNSDEYRIRQSPTFLQSALITIKKFHLPGTRRLFFLMIS